MVTYSTLSMQAKPFLAMTGLTLAEFRELLPAFEAAYERAYPDGRRSAAAALAGGRAAQRPGAGRGQAAVHPGLPEDVPAPGGAGPALRHQHVSGEPLAPS